MEYETVGAAVDGSAVGQPKYKVKAKRKPLEVFMNALFFLCGMVPWPLCSSSASIW